MTQNKYLYIIAILFLFGSCSESNKEPLKPSPSGAPGDLLVVVNEKIWDSYAGDTLRSMLAGPVEALPQNEPRFDVIQVQHKNFDKNFKQQRNILVVKVGSDQKESKVLYQRGLWARSQLLISVHAANIDSLNHLLNKHREEIVSLLDNTERARLMKAYHASMDEEIFNVLKEKYHLKMNVPKGYEIAAEEDDFIWLLQEYRDIIQGILIYKYPYTDPETFSRDFLAEKRDYYTKKYVPGEIEGSYVGIEPLFPPLFREYKLKGDLYTAELRGLWRMNEGLAMGGPFVSISQYHEAENSIITADAFVFAPGHEKRELLRQLEAIIFSLEYYDLDDSSK